ncbi:MAG: sporulation protein YabP [Eubacteriales bacterium]|nr:sporulation protein YabP [Eubacteriales bacterium]
MGRESQNKKESISMPHGLTLQDRSRMTLSGIKDVVNFDDTQVILNTDLGTLTIRGERMHVDQLNLDTGDLSLTGSIEAMEYDDVIRGGGFLGRLFR